MYGTMNIKFSIYFASFHEVSQFNLFFEFDVHVTVHRVKFLIIIPTRCTHFSNLFLE